MPSAEAAPADSGPLQRSRASPTSSRRGAAPIPTAQSDRARTASWGRYCRRNPSAAPRFFTASQEDEGKDVSKRVLQQAANRASARVGQALLGKHCELEEVSPALIAAVVAWLCRDDPLSQMSGGAGDAEAQAAGAVLVFLPVRAPSSARDSTSASPFRSGA